MESFTAMSDEGIQAVLKTQREYHMNYFMTLSDRDFAMLMYTLKLAWENGDQIGEWAGLFASDIAASLNIEFV